MKKIVFCSLFVAVTLLAAGGEKEQLKSQIRQQREMIEKLLQRVEALENKNKKAQERELKARIEKSGSGSASFSQQAFLPDIALIANMAAVGRNIGNDAYANYQIPGFFNNPGEIPFNPKRGFNLNYAELEISSTVDPYFDVAAALHVEKEGLHIGELFVTTRALPYNLRIKAGKFKSEFGRINPKHQHAWNFSSIPLVFETFFGPGGLSDEGIQIEWNLPTKTYWMAGFEAMQGCNERSFGNTDTDNLTIGYLKSSADITETSSILAGVTFMHGKNPDGHTDIFGADLTLKTFFGSYSALTWQNELLRRDKDGTGKQAGLYSELIYDYDQNWAVGIRYDTLFENVDDLPDDLNRYTLMMQYKPFEFSKLRLQYTYDRSKWIEGERRDIHEILLGLTIEAGAHGAHAF
jgi:hypothetical protein